MRKHYLIILFILFFAFLLRIQFINSPAIGFNNIKEAEYLSIAKGFLNSDDLFHRRVYFFSGFTEGPGFFELYPQFPFLSYWAYLVFLFFW